MIFFSAIFFVLWFLIMGLLVPIRNEPEENPLPGNAPSAPAKIFMRRKILAATLVCLPLTYGIMRFTGLL